MEQPTIGQSLTPEQVRDLPDGAKITAELNGCTNHLRIRRDGEYFAVDSEGERVFLQHWRPDQWSNATLVSLPSIEPKPCTCGYSRDCTKGCAVDAQAVGIDYGGPDKTAVLVVEPKASEIEKEAAAFYVFERFRIFSSTCRNMVEGGVTVQEREARISSVTHAIEVYRRAESYARSIGAIE